MGSGGSPGNAGAGPHFDVLEVGHPDYVALINVDTAFWVLSPRDQALEYLLGPELPRSFWKKKPAWPRTSTTSGSACCRPRSIQPHGALQPKLRLLLPARGGSAAGDHMDPARLMESLEILQDFFKSTLPEGARPQLVFHGAEPLLAKDAVFRGIEKYGDYFRFGVQTNATLLDQEAKDFLVAHGVGIGLSLDGPVAAVADRTRHTWGGTGVFAETIKALEDLVDYPGLNLITTVTKENVRHLPELVEFLHARGVGNALLNPVRGTQTGGRNLMPDQAELAHYSSRPWTGPMSCSRKPGEARHRQLCQPAVGAGGAGGPAADVRHLALRRRPLLLCGGRARRSGPVQRIPGAAGISRRQPLGDLSAGAAGDAAVQTDNHPGDRGLRTLQPLRGAPLLRGALPGGGLCP